MISNRPYLIRAMYDWICDNSWTPFLIVNAQVADVQVPSRFVQDGKIVLNISAAATQKLLLNNTSVEFDARFDAQIWHIYVPVEAVLAIYARENGQGMMFEIEQPDSASNSAGHPPQYSSNESSDQPPPEPGSPSPIKPKRPALKIVK